MSCSTLCPTRIEAADPIILCKEPEQPELQFTNPELSDLDNVRITMDNIAIQQKYIVKLKEYIKCVLKSVKG